jgi:flagellar export protein FliJ
MKRLEFRLEKVRDFRRQQLELEETKLEKLHAERRELHAESLRLEREAAATRRPLMATTSVSMEGCELAAADRYLRHLANARKRHTEKLTAFDTRLRKQQEAVLEARRRLRLIEKLEARQLSDWKREADREQENLSAELFLAQWNKP